MVDGWDESEITWVESFDVWRDGDAALEVVANGIWDGFTVGVIVVGG